MKKRLRHFVAAQAVAAEVGGNPFADEEAIETRGHRTGRSSLPWWESLR